MTYKKGTTYLESPLWVPSIEPYSRVNIDLLGTEIKS